MTVSSKTIMLLAGCLVAFAACNEGNRDDGGVLQPIDAGDTRDSSQSEVTPIPKLEAGDPCERNDQCESGLCANASADGKICSAACSDATPCPGGLTCVRDDADGICVKADVVACQPCRADTDCNVAGLTGNVCNDYGDAGKFCGNACDGSPGSCSEGYECTAGHCRLTAGECACNAAGIALGAETECHVTNAEGTCSGVRGCGAGGLSRCYADTPAAETCNGRDDNCDGATDEGTDGDQCDLTNEFGTCVGVVECTAGRPLCVGPVPAAEICNSQDDDCDGETDEGSPDEDEDGIADCLDDDWDNDGTTNVNDCQPRNAAVHPGSDGNPAPADVCNGVDDDCDRLVDNGEAAGCGCYVCGGAAGCLTSCDGDEDVDEGYACDVTDFDDDGDDAECIVTVCGNEIVEPGEVCDDGENLGRYGGCFACIELGGFCGDGRRQFEFELCDAGELNGTPGNCNDTCSGITGPSCGNGVQEEGEGCDLGDANSDAPNANCRLDCTPARCGDGIVDSNREEACDRGNLNGNDGTCGCALTCQFASAETPCRPAAGICDIADTCTGAGTCGPDVKQSGVTCGPQNGDCDVAEVCNGTSNTCPTDVVRPSTFECRAAGDDCDVAERCDGTSKACPDDDVAEPGVACRESTGDCDPTETCDGEGKACPDDSFFGNDVACREADGDCDVTEFCDGESADCPEDGFDQNFTVCHFPEGGCDGFGFCEGDSADCAYDGPFEAGTVCRGGSGVCDPEEVCDGESGSCPDDLVADNTTVCREGQGECDFVETCDGFGNCPEDSFFGQGTLCREEAGGCDIAEFCDGNSTVCPDDQVDANGTICNFSQGACDPWVICDGIDAECDYDGFHGPDVVCRFGDGVCDSDESCTGDSADCPLDIVADNTTICHPSLGACDPAETCDGFGNCPEDTLFGFGEPCRQGDGFCNPTEFCEGNSTQCPDDIVYGLDVLCHESEGGCDLNVTCDGTNGACPYDGPLAPGTVCNPSRGDCDPEELCTGGVDCPADLLADNTTVCRGAGGACDLVELCDGFNVFCPDDLLADNTTVCNPGDGACDPSELCNGVSDECPEDVVLEDGSDCTDSDDCDGASCLCMAGICEAEPSGRVWCFKRVVSEGSDEFTMLPTDPGGPAVAIGPGLKIDAAVNTAEFVGNPNYPSECPDVVGEGAMGWAQFDGDTSIGATGSGRMFCDGNPATVPTSTDPGAALSNTLAAAIECGDYYEFVSTTGPTVAFEFEERSPTGGPTNWALLVSLTGEEGTFVRAGGGLTNGPGEADFDPALPSPFHTVYLDELLVDGQPVTNQLDVHFRLYAWNASSPTYWIIDNVRINAPRIAQQKVWINEISYDNDQTNDAGEFVEVAGVAGRSLTGWKIELVNGSNGNRYKVDALNGSLSADASGVGYFVLDYAVVSGGAFQNGAPDGVALLSPDNQVIEFLSYEGTFSGTVTASATTTSATGSMSSTDIGVVQTTSPATDSLQRTGLFCLDQLIPMTWVGPVTATKGAVNTSQTISCQQPN